jgi:outer membrane protein W
MQLIKPSIILIMLLAILPAYKTSANDSDSFMIRGGYIRLQAHDVRGNVAFSGTPLPGSSLTVENENHYGFFLTWKINQNIALETILSTPLHLDVNAGGGMLGAEFKAATMDAMPLLLLARYTPSFDWHGFTPFISAGAAYILFNNKKTTDEFDAFAASLGANDGTVEVDNQLRPTVALGLDYSFDKKWFTNFTWIYIQGDDNIKVAFSNGAELLSDVAYKVQFSALTLGYRF